MPGNSIQRLILVIVMAAVAGLSGCGEKRGGQPRAIVFAVGGSPSGIRVWEDIAADFSRQTGISVRVLRQPTDTSQRRQGLLVALNSAQADPDVFLMDIAWLGLFAESGWLAPLGDVDTAPFFEEIVGRVDIIDGRLVALPVFLDVGVLYYRSDLLDGPPPRTWRELAEQADRIQNRMRRRQPDFYGFVWQGAQYEGLVVNFLEFAGRDGGFVLQDGRITVDTAQNVRALSLMVEFITTIEISPPHTFTEMQEEEVRLFFQSGKALFERNWPYAYALHQAPNAPVRGNVGVAELPAPQGGKSASTLGGWHVGVSAYSDAKQEARRFAVYLTSRPVQKKMALAIGLPPSRRALYDDEQILAQYPHYRKLRDLLHAARPRPVIPNYTLVSEIMQRRISGALAGDYAPSEALAKAQGEIDDLMARYGSNTDF